MTAPKQEKVGPYALCNIIARRLDDFAIEGVLNTEKRNELSTLFAEVSERAARALEVSDGH